MKLYFLLLLNIILTFQVSSQEKKLENRIAIGLNYGLASQNLIPFDNPKYVYDNKFYKIQINYHLAQNNKFSYELDLEPGIFYSSFQYLNTNKAPIELSFQEYVLNLGARIRYEILKNFSSYIIGCTGPMYSQQITNRLKDGFAFSNMAGIGISYKLSNISFNIRSSVRHNSNANLSKPNSGHNTTGIEAGFLIHL